MNDAAFMRKIQRRRQLLQVTNDFGQRQRSFEIHDIAQRPTADKGHDQVSQAIILVVFIHGDNVRMLK